MTAIAVATLAVGVAMFEFGQHPAVNPHLGAAYFVRGDVDPADFLATALGALCTHATLVMTRRATP